MTTSSQTVLTGEARIPANVRRVGYGFAIVINVILLWVVSNLVEWGWTGFITASFDDVVPIISFSLVLGIAVNVVYLFYDAGWARTVGDVLTSAVALLVMIQVFDVYPFEFGDGPWDGATRAIIIFIGIALAISVVANVVKLATGKTDRR